MRSLRGLGAEPRLIASKRPDRDHIGALTRRVVELAATVRVPLELAWSELGSAIVWKANRWSGGTPGIVVGPR